MHTNRLGTAVLACAALLGPTACGRDQPPEEPPPTNRGLGAQTEPQQQPEPPPPPPPPPPEPFRFPDDPQPAAAEPPQAAPEAAPAEQQGPPPRDYAGELKSLVGSPSTCLKPRAGATAPREINVTVEAVVMESGMVSRAYARSSELNEEELACIRARLGSARMGPAVEAAPRTVTTTISLVQQPGPAAPAAAAAQAPPGYDRPEPPPDYDRPEPAPPVDQPETVLPPIGAPNDQPTTGYGQPAPEQPQGTPQ